MRLKTILCLLLLGVGYATQATDYLLEFGLESKVAFDAPPVEELCVLEDPSNATFFEGPLSSPTLRAVNTAYFLPRASRRQTGVRVVDVLTDRVIKVAGDLTPFANERFENFFDYLNNPRDYQVFVGYNSDYQEIIEPLTQEAGQWPYYDETNTWIYVGNSAHQIETGDFLNFFRANPSQFGEAILPKVDQQMVDNGATISVQLVCSDGASIQLRRNSESGLDRLQGMNSPNTTEASLSMKTGNVSDLFSIRLRATQFTTQAGYNDLGWQIVEEKQNYLADCAPQLFSMPAEPSPDAIEPSLTWVNVIGDEQAQTAEDIVVDDSGNSYVVGHFLGNVTFGGPGLESGGNSAGYLAKYDPEGNHIFSIALTSGDEAMVTAVDIVEVPEEDGDVIVSGTFRGSLSGPGLDLTTENQAVFIARYDVSTGSFAWAQRYDGAGDVAVGDMVTDGTDAYLTGSFASTIIFPSDEYNSDGWDMFFVKVDGTEGNILLGGEQVFGGTDDQISSGIAATLEGDYYLSGHFKTEVDLGLGNLTSEDEDGFLAHFRNDGVPQHDAQISGTDIQYARKIALDNEGNVFLIGEYKGVAEFDAQSVETVANGFDIFLAKYSGALAVDWTYGVGSEIDDTAGRVAVDELGRAFFMGNIGGEGNNFDLNPVIGEDDLFTIAKNDVFVSILDTEGQYLSGYQIGGNASETMAYGIATGPENRLVVHGVFNGEVDFDPCGTNIESPVGDFDVFVQSIDLSPIPMPVVNFPQDTYCEGEGITPPTVVGTNVQWYEDAELTVPIFMEDALNPTNDDLNFSSVTATVRTVYVTQTVNDCESAASVVTLTVNGLPGAPEIVFDQDTYCEGEEIVSPTAVGSNLQWYGDSDLVSMLTTADAANPTNEELGFSSLEPGVVTVYVTSTTNGCEGPSSSVTLFVNSRPTSPLFSFDQDTYCVGEAIVPPTAEGFNLQWYDDADLTSPLFMEDAANPTNDDLGFASTEATVRTVYLTQSDPELGCESEAVAVTLTVNALPNAPEVTFEDTYCEGEVITPPTASGTDLQWYEDVELTVPIFTADASNPTNDDLGFANTPGTTTVYVTQTLNGCEGLSTAVTLTVNALPGGPEIDFAPDTYCEGETILAPEAFGSNLQWYADAGLTSAIATVDAASPTNEELGFTNTPGTTTVYVTQTLNGCEGPSTAVTLTVNAVPEAPAVNFPQDTYCEGEGITPPTVVGTNVQWYEDAELTVPIFMEDALNPTNDDLNFSSVTATVRTVYVTQTVNDCESAASVVTLTVNGLPGAPEIVFDQDTYCEGEEIVSPTAVGSNLQWYGDSDLVSMLTTADAANPTNEELGFSSLEPGVVTVYVTSTTNGCEGPSSSVTLFVNSRPPSPLFSFDQDTYCVGEAIVPPTAEGFNLQWYEDAELTSPLFMEDAANPTNDDLGFASTEATVRTVYLTQSDPELGCESEAVAVTLTVNALPNAPEVTFEDTYCEGEVITPPTASGTDLQWYEDVELTVPIFTADASNPTNDDLGFANTPGTTTVYVTQTLNGCEGLSTAVTLTVNALPGGPEIDFAPDTYCEGETILAPEAFGSNLQWYADAGLTSAIATVDAASPTNEELGFTNTPGTTTVYVTQTLNGCEGPSTAVTLTVNAVPEAPAVNFPQDTYCEGEGITPPTVAGTNVQWYEDAELTVPIFMEDALNPTNDDLNFSSVTATVRTVYVTQTVNDCESAASVVTLTVNGLPGAPEIVFDQDTYCEGEEIVSPTAVGSNLQWYGDSDLVSMLTTADAANPTNEELGFSSLEPGVVTVYVTSTTNGCEGPSSSVTLFVNSRPPSPLFSFDQDTYCVGEAIVPPTAEGFNLQWYEDAELTSPLFMEDAANPTNDDLGFASTEATVRTVYLTQSDPELGCESEAVAVTLTVNALPNAPEVTFEDTYCEGEVITPPTASGTDLQWYEDVELTVPIFTADASNPTNDDLGFANTPGTTTVYVTQTLNGCEGLSTAVTLTVNALPGGPEIDFAPDTYCEGETILAPEAFGSNLQWYADAGLTSAIATVDAASPTNEELGFTNTPGTTTVYVTQTLNGCEGPSTAVTLTVNAVPEAPAVNFPQDTYCEGEGITPPTVAGTNVQWYEDAELTVPIFMEDALNPTNDDLNFSSVTATVRTVYVTQTVNDCESAASVVTLTVNGLPGAPEIVFDQDTYCEGEEIVSPTAVGSNLQWYGDSDLVSMLATADAANPTNEELGFSSLEPGVVTVYVTSTTNGCEGPSSSVTLFVNSRPPSPLFSFDQDTYCVGEAIVPPTAEGFNLQWYEDAELMSPLFMEDAANPTNDDLGFASTEATVRAVYLTQSDPELGCESEAVAVTLTVNDFPIVPTITSQLTNNPLPTLGGSSSPGTDLTALVGGATYALLANELGTWQLETGSQEPVIGEFAPDLNGVNEVELTASNGGCISVDNTVGELTIDTTAPVVTIDDLTSSDNTPLLTGTVDDPQALVSVTVLESTYLATVDGTVWTAVVADPLLDGTYNVVVNGQDAAGNIGTDVSNNELTLEGTSVIPTVTIDALETFDLSPALSGAVDDEVAIVEITVDGMTYAGINDGNGRWSLAGGEIALLDVGTYDVLVEATSASNLVGTDNTGNELRVLPTSTEFASATDITVSTYTLTWDRVGGGVLSYVIEVSNVEDFSTIITSYQEPGDEDDFVVVSGVSYGTTYFNRLRVLYESGDVSEYSETLPVTTAVDPNTELDSLALVSIYQSTGGDQWSDNSNWLEDRLETWAGVIIEDARVTRLELKDNNLTGVVGDISEGLSSLLVMDLSGNELTDIGDVSTLTALQIADVSANRLPFGAFQDLQMLGAEVIYENQKEVLETINTLQEQGVLYILDREIRGQGNAYRWFKNDELIAATQSRIALTINSFDQEGVYYAEVTNPEFPDLTLVTRTITLRVSSLERDRVALLAVYQATNGNEWTNGADWPNNPNIDTWPGVVVENDRVVSLDLSNNNLVGEIPDELLDVVNLAFLDISGNSVTGIPDLRGLEQLTAPNVSDNLLDFGELEGNAQIASINYQNQRPIGEATEIRLPKGSNHIVSVPMGGTANEYQWLFDGFLDSREITGSTSSEHEITGLDYLRMGDYFVRVTNPLVPGLTLITERQTVLATTEVSFSPTYIDGNGSRQNLDEGEGFLIEVTRPGVPFDTVDIAMLDGAGLLFEEVVLGDYLVSIRTDSLLIRQSGGLTDSVRLLPTYFSSSFLWEEADTLRIRDQVDEPLNMQRRPGTVELGSNVVSLLVETDFVGDGLENARIQARRTVKRAGCSLRRRRRATGGRLENDLADFELIAYRETDDNGRVTFGDLPDGDYRLNIEYPGIPMDPNSFIEFTIGEGGLEENTLTLEATIDETGIEVQLIEILRVLKEYFEEIEVYPNPADKDLNIAYKGLNSLGVRAELIDLGGTLIKELELPRSRQQQVALDVRDINPGIYLLRVVDTQSSEGIMVFKVIIDR